MLHIYGATDRGMVRETNEDRFAGEVFDQGSGYAVVCDGMGGEVGGGIAAGIAAEEVRRMIESSLRSHMEERSLRLLLETARLFSTDPAAVPGNVQRLLDQQRELQRRFGQLEKAWVEAEAPALWAAAPEVAGSKVVALVLPGRSAEAVKQIEEMLA